LAVVAECVKMIDACPFANVCTVYNVLAITQLPMLARFINHRSFPSSHKTAHIVVATHSQTIKLVATLSAVVGSKRLRTVEVCQTEAEIEPAVRRWLMIAANVRAYTVDDL